MKAISLILASTISLSATYASSLNKTMRTLHLSSNEVTNVYKIYSYITTHVAYDWETYYGVAKRNKAQDALCHHRASCLGSARLFKDMCQKAHISSAVIKGRYQDEDHAWNTVSINHQTYLVDTVQRHFLIGQKSARDYQGNMKLARDDLTPLKRNFRQFGYYQYHTPKTITLKITYDQNSQKLHLDRGYWYANEKIKMKTGKNTCKIYFTQPGDYCISYANRYTHKKLHYYFMVN